jgi:CubicO group peptidase (beta-lactamase class C family)
MIRRPSRNTLVPKILVLASSLWVVSLASAATGREAGVSARIDAFVVAEMRKQKTPGVAVAVIRGGQVILARGYGEANIELHVPVGRATVFQSGSIGKQFTAVAVMLEVEDGKLALDDPITRYFPDAPAGWRRITVRNLLTHTSGIPTYSSRDINDRNDYSEDDLLKVIYGLPLEFEPGSRWSYSNTGYMLLGFIIRRASGRFYGDVLRDRVFVPLGMKTARVISEADIVANRSAGYQLVHGEIKNQDWLAPTLNTTADGALYLSLDDYIAWDRGLRANALLKSVSWSAIYTPVTLRSGRAYPYGFGWDVDRALDEPWYHHGGASQGFKTLISRYLADDLTVVVLANLADTIADRFADGITRILDPRLPQFEPDTPIVDQHPEVTERVRTLLRNASNGTLYEADLPRVRRDFFPEEFEACKGLLASFGGATAQLELVERRQLGDDWRYSYRAALERGTVRVTVDLTPQGEISDLSIEPR